MNESILKASFILTSAVLFLLINSDILSKATNYIKRLILTFTKK
jgi:hypothetical protein